LIASTLLLIKSRSLLPQLTLSTEEESDIEDLERRLRIYQRIKELSVHVKDRFGKNPLYFAKDKKEVRVIFTPDSKTNIAHLKKLLEEVLERIPKAKTEVKATIKKAVSIEEMIDSLTSRIQKAIKMSFKEFTGGSPKTREEKVTVIVSFLALLEMVKQGMVGANQNSTFDDIIVETENFGVPNYK
jgi:segregation and condensation protein A